MYSQGDEISDLYVHVLTVISETFYMCNTVLSGSIFLYRCLKKWEQLFYGKSEATTSPNWSRKTKYCTVL